MQRYRLPLLLGLAHALSDGAAGWLLGDLAHTIPLAKLGTLVLIYNVLAFGLAISLGGLPVLAGAAPFLAAPPGVSVMILLAVGLVWLTGRGLPAIHDKRYNRPYAATPD